MSEGTVTATPAAPSTPAAAPAPSTTQSTGFQKTGVEINTAKAPAAPAPVANGQAKPTEAQVQAAVDKFKLAIRGQERELDLKNPKDLEVLRAMAQKGEAAEAKFQEAAYMRKQAEDFVKILKTNPEMVLGNPAIGLDVQKWAEEFLWRRMEDAKKTPEQKEQEAKLKRLEELEAKEKNEADAKRRQEWEAAKEQYKGKLTEEIITTLAETNLPKSPRTVARMAHYIMQAKQNGWADVSPKDVVDLVREDYIQEHNELLGSLPHDELIKILNSEVRKRIREAELQALKNPAVKVPASEQPATGSEATRFKKGMSRSEWRKMVDDRTRGME